jgi:Flp pilus assembly CpaF family ATPase
MDLEKYLKTILDKSQIKSLKKAMKANKAIIIKGSQGPTGKSTLKSILIEKGYLAIEEHETFEVKLESCLDNPIASLETKISY